MLTNNNALSSCSSLDLGMDKVHILKAYFWIQIADLLHCKADLAIVSSVSMWLIINLKLCQCNQQVILWLQIPTTIEYIIVILGLHLRMEHLIGWL